MVLRTGFLMAAVGALAGTLVFLGLGRVLESLVYGVEMRDPRIVLLGVAGVPALARFLPGCAPLSIRRGPLQA